LTHAGLSLYTEAYSATVGVSQIHRAFAMETVSPSVPGCERSDFINSRDFELTGAAGQDDETPGGQHVRRDVPPTGRVAIRHGPHGRPFPLSLRR